MTERRALRAALIAARDALPEAEHRRRSDAIDAHLVARFPALGGVVAFYWPVRREFDPRRFVERLRAAGTIAALPVVARRDRPLEFRRWEPDAAMAVGPFGIPEPAAGPALRPDALLVPLVGFDAHNFRLGYGAGYYDLTLAEFAAKPLTIGLGFELGRLATIDPQPHDVPLDFIVTEAGVQPRR